MTRPNLVKPSIFRLLLKLRQEQRTGVLSARAAGSTIRIFLRKGRLMHAEGLDSDIVLLREISKKRGLSQEQFDRLVSLREHNPHALGQVLVEEGYLSQALWKRFVTLKARNHMAAVVRMKNPDMAFSDSEWMISSINAVNRDILEILLETLRTMKDPPDYKEYMPGLHACFVPSGNMRQTGESLPLLPEERQVLALVDGDRTAGVIVNATGLRREEVFRSLYLFVVLGLIRPQEMKNDETHYHEIISLYLDLLGILEKNFRAEMGRQFDTVFEQCKGALSQQAGEILRDITLSEESRERTAGRVYERFAGLLGPDGSPLALASALNEFLNLLLARMKKALGVLIQRKTLEEMLDMVGYVKKYSEDVELMKYVRGNLEDNLQKLSP
ncbi:MAG: hypothetical protein DRH56_04630 [Deltaproteobacteria bacterium]|nr:MAG: hypothetical protein DRH56_04630 [Deltaproteobacteria bacterium]